MQTRTLHLADNPPISLSTPRTPTPKSECLPETVTVHAYATYILPPLSESVIPVYAKTSLPMGYTGLLEPNPKLLGRYQVCGASQLVSLSEDSTFPFRVLNPTNTPITIYRCSTMGTFTHSNCSMSVLSTDDTTPAAKPSSPTNDTVPLDLTDSSLTESEKDSLRSLIAEYRDIFALTPDELGRTGLVKHHIDTENHPPIRQRPYRVADKQRQIIEDHVTDMLHRGIIQPTVVFHPGHRQSSWLRKRTTAIASALIFVV